VADPEQAGLELLGHELRSPVAALDAIARALAARRATLSGEERSRLIGLALAAGRDLERLLVDTTPFSVRAERVDLRLLLDQAAAQAAIRDLGNLLLNALAHAPAGGEVLVSARRRGPAVHVAVADRGEGIPPEELARIFDRGARATGARPGAGLGLYVARAIAEAHGGTLEAGSSPGAGATFTLVLPLGGAAA
jgi:signal transduction histidine kinase